MIVYEEAGMLGVLVTFKVAEGRKDELEAAFRWAIDAVRTNEPRNLLYQVIRSEQDESSYRIFELFEDHDAFMEHRNSAHAKEMHMRTQGLFSEAPALEFFNAI